MSTASLSAPHLGATLAAIARLEAADVRPPRLTQPGFDKWHRFRRKLGWRDFIELLHDDLAGAFPEPFDRQAWPDQPALDDAQAEALVRAAATPSSQAPLDFLRAQAEALGLTVAGSPSAAPKVQPHLKVLELAGTGGRIAAYQCANDAALSLDGPYTFVAASPAERIAIGLAAVELRANRPRILSPDELAVALDKGARFDRAQGFQSVPLPPALAERLGDTEVRLV